MSETREAGPLEVIAGTDLVGEPEVPPEPPAEAYEDGGEPGADSARVGLLSDMLAEPDEPVPWLVENVLSERALGMLAAEAYMTKSTLAGCLALHLAAGRDFLGWRIPAARPVLYWQTEGSVSRFKNRLVIAANFYGIDTNGLPLYLERTGLGEDFRSPAFRRVAEVARGGLVIADTSGAFFFGDENSAEEVRSGWVRPLKAVAAACDVAVLTVHHHGKPSKDREGHHKGRGSSALYGDFDTWLRLERVTGEPGRRALHVDKVREASAPEPLELDFLADRAALSVVGRSVAGDANAERVASAVAEMQGRILSALARNPDISGRQLYEFTRGKRPVFDEALSRLSRNAEVIGEPGPKGSVLWKKAVIGRVNR